MTAFVLVLLFTVAALATFASLADSALRGRRAYQQMKSNAPKPRQACVTVYSDREPVDIAALAKTGTYRITREFQCSSKLAGQNDLLPVAA